MSKMFYTFIFIFFVCPIMLSLVVIFGSFAAASASMAGMFGFLFGEPAIANRPDWNVINVTRGGSNVSGYEKLLGRDNFADGRIIRVSSIMSLDDIQRGDTTAVNPGHASEYALTSAPRLALQECALVLASLASKCVIKSTEIARVGGGNLYVLDMVLGFVEKDDFGTVKTEQPLSFIEINALLNTNGAESTRIDRAGQVDMRKKFYTAAVASCKRQRAVNGNCALQSLSIAVESERRAAAGNAAVSRCTANRTLDAGCLQRSYGSTSGYETNGYMVNISGRATLGLLQAQAK